jgi:hypothetical protein
VETDGHCIYPNNYSKISELESKITQALQLVNKDLDDAVVPGNVYTPGHSLSHKARSRPIVPHMCTSRWENPEFLQHLQNVNKRQVKSQLKALNSEIL